MFRASNPNLFAATLLLAVTLFGNGICATPANATSLPCDTNADGVPDANYTCDADGDGIDEACASCDTDGDGVRDACHLCDTNGDGENDACFDADLDGDGVCEICGDVNGRSESQGARAVVP